MPKNIFRISVAALLLVLLAIPLTVAAAGDLGSGRPKELMAHFAIYAEPEMNLNGEIRFIEDNTWGSEIGFTIDIIFATRPMLSFAYDRDFPLPTGGMVGRATN